MKKLKKFLILFFLITLTLAVAYISAKLMLQFFNTAVYADVGSFEDYGGGSDFR